MSRRRMVVAVVGVLMLTLSVSALALARGIENAADSFRAGQAVWQRGLKPTGAVEPDPLQRAGESLLGIRARSDVQRVYQDYRAGLTDVIPGTTYPQARARFEAIGQLQRLRASLRNNRDRASVDVVLGVVLVDGADTAGQQRRAQLEKAAAAFVRAIREDPANVAAKLDLEVLLRSLSPRSRSRPTPAGTPNRRRQRDENPRSPTAPARAEGNGF